MLQIDRLSAKPIYEQIIEQLKRLIMLDIWDSAEPLPSVRALSRELSINPNTLQKAYAELESLGICYSVAGNGRFVSPEAVMIIKAEQAKRLDDLAKLCSELALADIPLESILKRVEASYCEALQGKKKGEAND